VFLLTVCAHLIAPIILILNKDYFSIKHQLTGLHDGDSECLLRGWGHNVSYNYEGWSNENLKYCNI